MAYEKICIIGGGPAGLYCAIEGAKKGLNVTLYDKGRIGEDIRCAEGFIDIQGLIGKPEHGVKNKINELIIQGEKTFYVDTRNVNLWMIDRKEWQVSLCKKAKKLGVEIKEFTFIEP